MKTTFNAETAETGNGDRIISDNCQRMAAQKR
jgi:hypothetical protein